MICTIFKQFLYLLLIIATSLIFIFAIFAIIYASTGSHENAIACGILDAYAILSFVIISTILGIFKCYKYLKENSNIPIQQEINPIKIIVLSNN